MMVQKNKKKNGYLLLTIYYMPTFVVQTGEKTMYIKINF